MWCIIIYRPQDVGTTVPGPRRAENTVGITESCVMGEEDEMSFLQLS